jgi:tetratricopeptide (TPR) repeat protein
MSAPSLNLAPIVEGHAAALLAEGNLDQALIIGGQSVATARTAVAGDPRFQALLVQALENLAEIERSAERWDESEGHYREALQVAEKAKMELEIIAEIRTSLAALLDVSGRELEALPVYEQAIEELEKIEPLPAVTIGRLLNNVALTHKRMGKLALAEQYYLRALEALEAAYGGDSEEVAALYNNLGGLYYSAGFPDQAKGMFEAALESRRQLLGDDHPDVAQSLSNLATSQHELGELAEAQSNYEASLAILEALIDTKADSYNEVGQDYLAMLGSIEEDQKAAAFQQRMKRVLQGRLA